MALVYLRAYRVIGIDHNCAINGAILWYLSTSQSVVVGLPALGLVSA